MVRPARSYQPPPPHPLQVQVLGPDTALDGSVDVRRLLGMRSTSRIRRDRLSHATCVVARSGRRTVGIAAYERTGSELRVLEVAVDVSAPLCPQDIIGELLQALEMAALAGGCKRIVLLPAAVVAASTLESLGYQMVGEHSAVGWLEKTLL